MNNKIRRVELLFLPLLVLGLAACDGGNQQASSGEQVDAESSSVAVSSSSVASSIVPAGSSLSVPSSAAASSSVALDTVLFDIDSAAFCGGAGVLETTHLGFTGNAYFNGSNAQNAAITWQVNASTVGEYTFNIQFANGSDAERPATLSVNGEAAATLSLAPTQAWDAWQSEAAIVQLAQGENEIRLIANSAAGLANINYLSAIGNGISGGECPEPVVSCSGTADVDIAALMSCNGNPAECIFGGDEGHYHVAMEIDESFSGNLDVYAEARRKMISTPISNGGCVDFLVNVRSPEGQPIQNVDRGIDGLNLRLNQNAAILNGLSVKKVDNPTVLFIAGDSTVADQEPQLNKNPRSRFTGWGQFIPQYFNSAISVENYADSGEGTAAFRTDGGGLWNLINRNLKANDWVLIQLGHNDKTTSASVYRSRINGMVSAIKAKGATPVLISPMVRNTGSSLGSQHIYGGLNVRNELMRISNEHNVAFIDLMQLSSEWALSVGQSTAQTYFVDNDRTHSNELGADLFAKMIVDAIRQQNIALTDHLKNL
ncbi:GDSL-type esterase/lipase family protein [Marinagarivorans cellulosilyticus]|uniref:CBM6 domain-containing protein n=1 Tax=Marinagarivorans cellulosilyticus TaxID=2721545 RepID=A0AAN2BIJ2_9GAMM|nr:GDSL-type esterase/lipase family protein [Marinagarivorans cellulosilyticus]BCD95958.1 hypothetical protein MARGE09_P0157 [Marinagarivorans cellulosilyticus]